MPTSVLGSSSRRARGFTLIELLVVALVFGIAISPVAVGTRRSDGILEQEAQRLAVLLEHAGQQARIAGAPLAWQVTATGYLFLRREESWVVLPEQDKEILRPRQLPAGISVQGLALRTRPSAADSGLVWQLSFPPAGLARPFELRMVDSTNNVFRIVGDADGRVVSRRELAQ